MCVLFFGIIFQGVTGFDALSIEFLLKFDTMFYFIDAK